MLVFTALFKVQSVGAVFSRGAFKPELSHFTIQQNNFELNLQQVPRLKDNSAYNAEVKDKEIVFTRESFLQAVCPQPMANAQLQALIRQGGNQCTDVGI